jgi:lysophospholipase L1-like esterase
MTRRLTLLGLFLLAWVPSILAEEAVPRILIVGDSWAASVATKHHDPIPPGFGTFDAVLQEAGFSGIRTEGSRTAWGGRKASDWVKPENLALIREELDAHLGIRFVHLIIGGNDFLTLAQETPVIEIRGKTQEERGTAYWQPIVEKIRVIIETALEARPDVCVVLAEYDYLDPPAMEKAYGFNFQGASTEEVNTWLVELGEEKAAMVRAISTRYPGRAVYVENWGALQEKFTGAVRGPAGGMPAEAQVGDGVHPNDAGHRALLQKAIREYYLAWLNETKTTLQCPKE